LREDRYRSNENVAVVDMTDVMVLNEIIEQAGQQSKRGSTMTEIIEGNRQYLSLMLVYSHVLKKLITLTFIMLSWPPLTCTAILT
jgi:hypothetical protein